MKEIILDKFISKGFKLSKVDMHDLSKFKSGMMKFNCETYKIEGVGNLMFLQMNSILNLMKMQTTVICPQYKDLSFMNADTFDVLSKHTGIVELYESSIEDSDLSSLDNIKEEYKDLKDYVSKPRWYDSMRLSCSIGKLGNKKIIEEMCLRYIDEYLDLLSMAKDCDYNLKQQANSIYVDQLIEKGGVAVDSLNKMIGKDKCETLVKKYMFNTI